MLSCLFTDRRTEWMYAVNLGKAGDPFTDHHDVEAQGIAPTLLQRRGILPTVVSSMPSILTRGRSIVMTCHWLKWP